MKWRVLTAGAASATLSLAVLLFVQWKYGTPAVGVESILVSPQSETGGEIMCERLALVAFTYEIRNRSEQEISGLKLGLGCGCEALGSLPDEIPPGESARVNFRLRAPIAGVLRREIPLLVEGRRDPLLVLKPVLRVKFDPPGFLRSLVDLNVTNISDDTSPRQFEFDTIEAKGSDPWIRRLDVNPSGMLEVVSLEAEELPFDDPLLMRRHYRFQLVQQSLKVGEYRVNVILQTRPGSPPVPKPVNVAVNILDTVEIIPNPLVFRYKPGQQLEPKRVQVIYRTGRKRASIASYDEDLLRVAVVGEEAGRASVFDVTPLALQAPSESQVVFNVGNNQTRTLAVRFETSQLAKDNR